MKIRPKALKLASGDPRAESVSAVIDLPERPRGHGLMLTHGSGSDLASRGLTALSQGVARQGHPSVRFNLPYREQGAAFPPAAEKSVPAFTRIAAGARAKLGPRRQWIVGGRSYGARVASMAVAEGLPAKGLVFYSYPLHPPGKLQELRVAHWPRITVPCLFLQGTDDEFCDLALLVTHVTQLGAPATIHVVDGGDHALQVPAAKDRARREEEETLETLARVVAKWIAALDRPAP